METFDPSEIQSGKSRRRLIDFTVSFSYSVVHPQEPRAEEIHVQRHSSRRSKYSQLQSVFQTIVGRQLSW